MKLAAKVLALVLLALAAYASPSQAFMNSDEFRRANVSIISSGSRAAQVARLKQVPSVTVIRIRNQPRLLNSDNDPSELGVTAGKFQGGIAKLRSALSRNPVTRNALARKNVPVNRVVGVEIFSNGALKVYLY